MRIDLSIHTELARKILTGFIRSEVTRTGFTRAVIGLSGGIDSALSCALAAEALGPGNVLALRMPYQTSSSDSLEDAEKTAARFGVRMETIEITPMVQPIIQLDPHITNVRKGNLMARARMILLYDQSEVFHGLVVGTSNKTEILLGYTTLWGDMASALNPIGDLYKTQVRQLSRAMDVPRSVVEKAPSADLWLGQTDEGELGFTYEEVDQLLYLLVDRRYSVGDCVAAGFSQEFVDQVLERIRRSQYKRMMPPIAKLSNRTIGYDFLYLRDWGT
ncbi:MAG TPA: NAD+ synthase [Anaerolineales bacterium]|nr:NAD+ synthase [Anaerolineales bacterium]